MANRARAKGTSWEVELLPILRELFGDQVERAPLKGVQDKGDYTGTPLGVVEAKNTQKPLFQQWARTAANKAGKAWVVIWKGDRRTRDGGPFVLQPIELWKLVTALALMDGIPAENRMALLRGFTQNQSEGE